MVNKIMNEKEKHNLKTIHEDYSLFKKGLDKFNEFKITPLFICVGGSRCYGTFREDSDTDIRGVFLGEPKHYIGLSKIEQISIKREGSNETDTLMELRKFLNLALANNPNIIEQLFLNKEHMLYIHPLFETFLENRHLFLSKKCKHSYSGYAFSQLKRIQGHYEWLENPPKEPKQEDYAITRYKHKITGHIIPECDYLAKEKRIKAIAESGNLDSKNKISFFEDLDAWEKIKVIDKGSWDKALDKYKQYLTWRKNRNEVRAKLEAEYNYDVKHASHLVRLLLQGKQILQEHTLNTYLREEELKIVEEIKSGKYTYPKLIQFAESMNKELEELYVTSELRNSPDTKTIEFLCMRVINNFIMETELEYNVV